MAKHGGIKHGVPHHSPAGRHPAHHGYLQPAPSVHHAARHDGQMNAIDREHSARNMGRDGSTASVGGSMAIHDPGNKGKTPKMATEMPALRKASGGRPDTASGSNVE